MQPGGLAELVPGRGGRRDAAVGCAGGAVVGVGGLAQDAAAEHGGGDVQGVGGGPGGVGGGGRVRSRPGPGSARWRRRRPGWRAPRARSAPRRSAGARPGVARCGVHRCRSLGQVRSAASFPPPYQTGPPSLVVSPGSATAYPVTWPGFLTLNRWRTSTPAWSRRAKNSSSLLADGGGGGDLPAQRDPGCLVQAAAGGLLVLGAGRAAGRGAVGRGGGAQPVALLGGQAGVADLVPFPATRWACRRPGGPASPPGGCGHRRAGPRSSARPRLPARTGTARCGASRRARSAAHSSSLTASGPRGRRASSSATPAARTPACRGRPAAAGAARSAW